MLHGFLSAPKFASFVLIWSPMLDIENILDGAIATVRKSSHEVLYILHLP